MLLRIARALGIAIALAIVFGSIGGLGWALYSLGSYLATVPKEIGAALIAAVTTVLVATLTVTLGKYFERKKELDALYRDKKLEIYDQFLKQFFAVWFTEGKAAEGEQTPDMVAFFRDFTSKLVLWGGPEVVQVFAEWKEHLAAGSPDAQSVFLTEKFLNAIRADLRHSNKGLGRGWFARLFLRESRLFLAMAAKDPNVSLDALSAAEKYLQELRSKTDV
jgi:hypothetical protein